MATLSWSEQGYSITHNGLSTKPFPALQFEHISRIGSSGTSEVVTDELTDLLKPVTKSEEELTQLRKDILCKYMGIWEKANPTMWLGRHPAILDQYMRYIERWVKHDEVTRRIIFLTALSAYSPNPVNLFLRGPSSIGKTFVTLQTIKLFPSSDVWLVGGMTPKALIHRQGKMYDSNGMEVGYEDLKKGYGNYDDLKYVVDLSHKILVFLEAPHIETYTTLRPILSHDTWEIVFPFVDKTTSGQMRTKDVYVRGWPATVFCTIDPTYQEELATRSLNMTPEMTQEKYRDSIIMQGERAAEPWNFQNPDWDMKLYMANLKQLTEKIKHFEVVLPYGHALGICYPHTQPRDMRDFSKLTTLIQQVSYFFIFQRPWIKGTDYKKEIVLATLKDFKTASYLFNYVAETTRSGIPGNVVMFFNEVIDDLWRHNEGLVGYESIVHKWMEVYHTTKSREVIRRQYMQPLLQAGWVDEEEDTENRRKTVFRVLHGPEAEFSDYEKKFLALFKESQLEEWMRRLKERFSEAAVYVGGEEVDWVEFPYRYFETWS